MEIDFVISLSNSLIFYETIFISRAWNVHYYLQANFGHTKLTDFNHKVCVVKIYLLRRNVNLGNLWDIVIRTVWLYWLDCIVLVIVMFIYTWFSPFYFKRGISLYSNGHKNK